MAVQAQPRVVEPEPHERQQEVHLNMIKRIVSLKNLFSYIPYFSVRALYIYMNVHYITIKSI